jgi:AcrR family transcriptional regulator
VQNFSDTWAAMSEKQELSMTMNDVPIGDARKLRTRQAIHTAFLGMVLERRYYEIKIDDIVEHANIARSTFYEHFKSKDELLASSLEGPFSRLVNLLDDTTTNAALVDILEHFWRNRAMARGIFSGAIRKKVSVALADMIQKKLATQLIDRKLPLPLISIQLSEMMLTPISAWLMGQATCSTAMLAEVLRKSVMSTVRELKSMRP